MLRPVGTLPSAVYWRRRLVMLGAAVVLLVLLVLTVKAVDGGDDPTAAAATTSQSLSSTPATTTATSPRHSRSVATTTAHPATSGNRSNSASASSSSSAPPAPCASSQLRLAAVVEHSTYNVGDEPVVMLQATDTASAPCVQDFGSGKVELRVYNGESRVWGSNDCGSDSGPVERTLLPNQPVRVRITWSGLSSEAGCQGTRQRVGAGTYTLYASLDGHPGSATQFAFR